MQVDAHAAFREIAADRDRPVGAPKPRRLLEPFVLSRSTYIGVLAWSFAFFSSARILAYLPTLWAIYSSGDANQHSIWTWLTWFGSNLTMAAWLYEQAGQRMSRAALVSLCNAAMCGLIVALIVSCRW